MTAPPRYSGRNWPVMRRDVEPRQLPAPTRVADAPLPTLRPSQHACYEALGLALREGHVFAALTGPAASGKTIVLNAVLADRRDRALRVIRITEPERVPAGLATQIEQVAYAEAGKPENQERHVVLAVDDAHLASDDLLLCLSRLAQMREPGRRVPQVLLAGRPELWDRLATEDFEPLARRLAIRAALPAAEDEVDDPWATVEDEVAQTMARLRDEASVPARVADYDEVAERERLFGTSQGYGPSNNPVAPDYDDKADVPPPSVFALFPDPPPAPPSRGSKRSTARETRRRLLMPLVSLFVGLAAFAFALSFYDWPDLIGELPWAESKPSEPFIVPSSPQARSFGIPLPPPSTTTKPAANAPKPASTPLAQVPPAPVKAAPTAVAPPPPPPVVAATPTPPPAAVTASVAQSRPEPTEPARPAVAEPVPAASTPPPPVVQAPPVTQAVPDAAPASPAPVAAPVAAPTNPPAVAVAAANVPPAAAAAKASPSAAKPATSVNAPLAPALVALLLRRGDEENAIGDISAARLLYERAAEAGSGLAARQLARTYDSAYLPAAVEAVLADPARAKQWYGRAAALGNPEAAARLKTLNGGR